MKRTAQHARYNLFHLSHLLLFGYNTVSEPSCKLMSFFLYLYIKLTKKSIMTSSIFDWSVYGHILCVNQW